MGGAYPPNGLFLLWITGEKGRSPEEVNMGHMDTEKQAELVRLYVQMQEAAELLHTQAEEVYEMTKRIEELTKDTLLHYAGLRAKVEARAAFEQATDLHRELEEMGKELRGQA